MSANKYLFWQVNENNFIEIKDGQMTTKNDWRTVTDRIENYTLKYFKISKRLRVHFILQNFENIVQWDYRGVVKHEDKEVVEQFVNIMQSHGLFQNRSMTDLLLKDTDQQESDRFLQKFKPGEIKCPQCGGKNYHAFVEERVVRGGIERMEVKRRPHLFDSQRSVFYRRQRYVVQPKTKHVSKFVCDDCGKIF